jgi:hypothetical protein
MRCESLGSVLSEVPESLFWLVQRFGCMMAVEKNGNFLNIIRVTGDVFPLWTWDADF